MTSSDFVFGLHAVKSLFESKPERILELWIQKGRTDKKVSQLLNYAKDNSVIINFADREKLDILADGVHQGVIAKISAAKPFREGDLEDLLDALETQPLLLVLDCVTDPHNLGACLRTANAAGVHAVITPRDKSASLNATARKVACGAAEAIPLIQVTNLARTLIKLKKRGIWLTGTTDECSDTIYQTDLNVPIALLMGAEGKGLRRLTREHCDTLACIPMTGKVSSLNVSVATGVCLFEAVRQRENYSSKTP
ncbi:MAG: 23S rRNA (guanosine(2251)-2'-O)-methyltransferase RlmB [Candidatus Endonucleobacter bathymodioli]|uniref:23S rRNA (guanosine-2'-O-)-methyltransferase RlmB n=1 Tax=Candidatus Endonucleibacter bathymodioli TaxID=539814 RepID=A0AA90NUS1_9GAMM|nr:23S rRNA (guanosine(2251)-2'-O)-methyltransferase RlmB [Candidatus Endonucleobacter bathymodioli]